MNARHDELLKEIRSVTPAARSQVQDSERRVIDAFPHVPSLEEVRAATSDVARIALDSSETAANVAAFRERVEGVGIAVVDQGDRLAEMIHGTRVETVEQGTTTRSLIDQSAAGTRVAVAKVGEVLQGLTDVVELGITNDGEILRKVDGIYATLEQLMEERRNAAMNVASAAAPIPRTVCVAVATVIAMLENQAEQMRVTAGADIAKYHDATDLIGALASWLGDRFVLALTPDSPAVEQLWEKLT